MEYPSGQSFTSLPSDKQGSELCSVTHLLCVAPDLFIFPDSYSPQNFCNWTKLNTPPATPQEIRLKVRRFPKPEESKHPLLSPDCAETASARWGPPACNFVHVLFHRKWLTRMGIWVILTVHSSTELVLCAWIVTVAASVSRCHQITVMFPLSPQAMMNVIFQCLPESHTALISNYQKQQTQIIKIFPQHAGRVFSGMCASHCHG